jgi:hypothetical protein
LTALVNRLTDWSPTSFLEQEYDALLERKTFLDLATDSPHLHILATSLTSGHSCSFSVCDDRFARLLWRNPSKDACATLISALRLATAVAASSAFPAFFPPVKLTSYRLQCAPSDFPQPQFIADGGVYDNLGITALKATLKSSDLRFSHTILSDAEGSFDWDADHSFRLLTSRVMRVTDILMKTLSESQSSAQMDAESAVSGDNWRQRMGHIVYCPINSVVAHSDNIYGTNPQHQAILRGVRTDLDGFSSSEQFAVAAQGDMVARSEWIVKRLGSVKRDKWSLLESLRPSKATPRIDAWRLRKLRLFSCTDWVSYMLWPVLICIIIGIGATATYVGERVMARYSDLATLERKRDDRRTLEAELDRYRERMKLHGGRASVQVVDQKTWLGQDLELKWDRVLICVDAVERHDAIAYAVLMGQVIGRIGDDCAASDAAAWILNELGETGVVKYLLSTELDSDQFRRHFGGGPENVVYSAFRSMHEQEGVNATQVHRLAIAILNECDCGWNRQNVEDRVLALNKSRGLGIAESIIRSAFHPRRGFRSSR